MSYNIPDIDQFIDQSIDQSIKQFLSKSTHRMRSDKCK